MTKLLKPPNLASRVAAGVMVIWLLAPLTGFADAPSTGITAPIAGTHLGSLELLGPAPTPQRAADEGPATQPYPFTEVSGWDLSRGWYFGKPAYGRARVGFVWENPAAESSLSTIHLSTKGLRLERRF